MKSHDFVREDKLLELQKFCNDHSPKISLSVETTQKINGTIRVVAETDIYTMVKYDDYLYLLNNGKERERYEKPKEIKKKWWQFWRKKDGYNM